VGDALENLGVALALRLQLAVATRDVLVDLSPSTLSSRR
jgi:hypothetical protein